jgi:hypothetical protein
MTWEEAARDTKHAWQWLNDTADRGNDADRRADDVLRVALSALEELARAEGILPGRGDMFRG